jgi:hypothetical protein
VLLAQDSVRTVSPAVGRLFAVPVIVSSNGGGRNADG